MGFDPKQKNNLPNRLYLGQLHLTATDVYKMPDFSNKTAETLDMSGTENSAVNQEEYNNLDTNRY